MCAPVKGAYDAVMRVARYCVENRDMCLFQPWGTDCHTWRFYSDSDLGSNSEAINKRRSRLSHIGVLGSAPIEWGSRTTKVSMGPDLDSCGASHAGLDKPVCHPDMVELHADVSSAAAEIFAASVALNEFLHLSYMSEELGFAAAKPIHLEVDNATAIMFSKEAARRSKLKHIDSRQAWVEALRDSRIVKLVKVHTDENIADMNSKLLDPARFRYLRSKIMTSRSLPATGKTA